MALSLMDRNNYFIGFIILFGKDRFVNKTKSNQKKGAEVISITIMNLFQMMQLISLIINLL